MTDSIQSEITALRSEVKALAKLVRKIRAHQEDPTGEKAAEKAKTNGFNRVTEVSPELRKFLGLADDEEICRSEVTRRINKYIQENNLKDPNNGRVIVLDDKLRKLLAPPDDTTVTFLNMQRFVSPHYNKPPTPAAAAPVSTTTTTTKKTTKKTVKV